MTVKEFYEAAGEDYGAVERRFGSAEFVRHLCGRFRSDTCFSELTEALRTGDAGTAFRAAHTLKGVCLNLGFTRLGSAASDLTERLRGGSLAGTDEAYAGVAEAYRKLLDLLNRTETEVRS